MTLKKCSFFVNNCTDKIPQRFLVRFSHTKQVLSSMMRQRTITLYSDTSPSAATPIQRSGLNKVSPKQQTCIIGSYCFFPILLVAYSCVNVFLQDFSILPAKATRRFTVHGHMLLGCNGRSSTSKIFGHISPKTDRRLQAVGTDRDES